MGGGGAERQLAYLTGEMVRIGWEVHVALTSGGPNLPRLRATGAVVHTLPARGNHDPRLFGRLLRLMRAVRPDLVQVWLVQMEILAGVAATLLRVPWILSERSSRAAYPSTLKHRLRRLVAVHASAIVANSTGGDEYWRRGCGRRTPGFVIPNAVPLEEIEATPPAGPAETGLAPEQRLVLHVGRLSAQKNLGALLSAIRPALARPDTVAVLCGDGPLRGEIARRLAEDAIGDRVQLRGYVPDIWRWMKRADVLVSASLFEGRPNAVLEAMACGCPLVVSDIPAHREFLDEESALLVDPHGPEALGDAIVRVLSDRNAAARRAARARARAAEWSVAAIARQYDHLYAEILAGGRGSGPGPVERAAFSRSD